MRGFLHSDEKICPTVSCFTHGGDIYNNDVELDFSVNINPLGMPKKAREALISGVEEDSRYPDINCLRLAQAVSERENVSRQRILFGNGASELIMAAVRAVKPDICIMAAPTFSGYERAAQACGARTAFYELDEKKDFAYDDGICRRIEDIAGGCKTCGYGGDARSGRLMVFLCSPNNPVGSLISPELTEKIASVCSRLGAVVVVDECFLRFTGRYEEYSSRRLLDLYDNLIVINAFTKFFAMAGIRLGYAMTSNTAVLDRMRFQMPEWSVSTVAQRTGLAALGDPDYEQRTVNYVQDERRFLEEGLGRLGMRVYAGFADFVAFRTEEGSNIKLYEELLKKKILIRSCADYRNMPKNSFRAAVRRREENEILLKAMREILNR
jgi:threonine-phosphate decarboxylase